MVEQNLIGPLIGAGVAVVGAGIALLAAGIIKHDWKKTSGKLGVKPVTKEKLKQLLLKLNKPKHPFKILDGKERADLIVDWQIVDAKWIEILGVGWKNKRYLAWVGLNDADKTVRVCEQITEIDKSVGLLKGGYEINTFTGIQLWRKERAYAFGIKTDFSVGEIYNYKFDPEDVKDLLRQIANDNGWSFALVVSKGQTKKRE